MTINVKRLLKAFPKPVASKRKMCGFKIKDKELELYEFLRKRITETQKPFMESNAYLAKMFGCSIKSVSLMLSSLNKQGKIRVSCKKVPGPTHPVTARVVQLVRVGAPVTILTPKVDMSQKLTFKGKEIVLSKESIEKAFLGKAAPKYVGAEPVKAKVVAVETPKQIVEKVLANIKYIPFDKKDLTNNTFPIGLNLTNHPVIKDLLNSNEIPYWNRWKEEIAGYSPKTPSTIPAVIQILERMREVVVARYGAEYDFDSTEVINKISTKISEFYGA